MNSAQHSMDSDLEFGRTIRVNMVLHRYLASRRRKTGSRSKATHLAIMSGKVTLEINYCITLRRNRKMPHNNTNENVKINLVYNFVRMAQIY